ncbi:MAG: lamin tail domain-containing protein [bacterium]
MKLYIFTFLSSLILTADISGSQVVLTEIMFDAIGSDSHDEFIEIFNPSVTDSVDLSGWQVSDGSGYDAIIAHDQGTVLKPGQFGLILDPSYFDNSSTYDELIPENCLILTLDNSTFGSRGLSNSTPETVSVLDALGNVVSEYTYSTDNAAGISDEKIDLTGSNSSANWGNSRTILGTPGARNSVSALNYDLAVLEKDIIFTPPQVEKGESVAISAVVKNVGLLPVTDFQVTFYVDSDGDSVFSANEALSAPLTFQGSLAPADSVEFSSNYQVFASGRKVVAVLVYSANDQNPANNLATRDLLVAYEPQSVVVNEIMYSPLADLGEWIEIVNTSSTAIDLNQWSFSDADTTVKIGVPVSLPLAPGQHLVLAQDASILDFYSLTPNSFAVLKNWSALNNDLDSVVLFDLTSSVVDRVDYHHEWGGARGVSLEKIHPKLASNHGSNWSSSVDNSGATPGRQNSLFTDILPARSSLTIEPNPFSPDGDGQDDFAVIGYELPLYTALVNIKIYDLRGRLVRFLLNNQPSGSNHVVLWDGRDDQAQKARMGIYIVFLQALNEQSGVLKTEKKTVILAGRL